MNQPQNQPQQVQSIDAAMELAITHANQVKGTTYPNPPVGCVIVDQEGLSLIHI